MIVFFKYRGKGDDGVLEVFVVTFVKRTSIVYSRKLAGASGF